MCFRLEQQNGLGAVLSRFSLWRASEHGRSKLGEVDTGGTALVWRVGKNIDNVE